MNNILIVTAVDAERDAILRGLNELKPFDVIAVGVGSAAAAAGTAKALSEKKYDLVVCAGIGGGFTEHTKAGDLVIADEIIAADLGSETKDGFLSVEDTRIGYSRCAVDQPLLKRLQGRLQESGIAFVSGPIITVSTATGTAETADILAKRVTGACAEGMEGFGAACAAKLFGVPCIEMRAISNEVGPRDRDSWRISEALEILTKGMAAIQEVLI